jgi:signal transduction histidine kinase
VPALQAYAAERLDPLGVAWELQVDGDEYLLSPPADMVLFRVVQEAVSNIARHAHAQRVVITILSEVRGITVQVCDDGVGFDVDEKLDPGRRQLSFGLLGMQERLETVKGLLHVQSAPGQGTQLRVFVPRATEGGNRCFDRLNTSEARPCLAC